MKQSQLNQNKPKMETMQVINDGADEEDFKELLEILKDFGQVKVLYNPDDPKDKNVTADEVIERYDNFKKRARKVTNALNDTEDEETREDGFDAEGCVPDATEGTGEFRGRSCSNETNTTISTAA